MSPLLAQVLFSDILGCFFFVISCFAESESISHFFSWSRGPYGFRTYKLGGEMRAYSDCSRIDASKCKVLDEAGEIPFALIIIALLALLISTVLDYMTCRVNSLITRNNYFRTSIRLKWVAMVFGFLAVCIWDSIIGNISPEWGVGIIAVCAAGFATFFLIALIVL
jgi:hypothetical protein